MPKISIKITGFEEISANIRAMTDGFTDQVALPALVDAMEVVRDEARTNAALYIDDLTTPAYIPENIQVMRRIKYGKQIGAAVVSVGMKRGARRNNNTWYWWWIELGSKNHKAKPFLRKAAFDNLDQVFRTFYNSARYNFIKLSNYAHISTGSGSSQTTQSNDE